MAKKYNIGSKADMRRFERDFKKDIVDSTKKAAQKSKYEIECRGCGKKIMIPVGKSKCPKCGEEFNLELDLSNLKL